MCLQVFTLFPGLGFDEDRYSYMLRSTTGPAGQYAVAVFVGTAAKMPAIEARKGKQAAGCL